MTDQKLPSNQAPDDRVYLLYNGNDENGCAHHVIAKNRNEAKQKARFTFTHVSYRPWVRFENGKFIDATTGREMEVQ